VATALDGGNELNHMHTLPVGTGNNQSDSPVREQVVAPHTWSFWLRKLCSWCSVVISLPGGIGKVEKGADAEGSMGRG